MRHNLEIFEYEQHLSRCAANFCKQMAALENLREMVHLAEVAKTSHRSKGLARSAVNSKVVYPFAGSQLRV